MDKIAKLTYTSNPAMQEFIGLTGVLGRNEQGGYSFKMFDNGRTIQTSAPKHISSFGDVNSSTDRNISFETNSGSVYQFDLMEMEKTMPNHDVQQRPDNNVKLFVMQEIAELTYTSNPAMQEYVGLTGTLGRNEQGGYSFKMFDNGRTIQTSPPRQISSFGDVNSSTDRNISFETNSGSVYQFNIRVIEKSVNNVPKEHDNIENLLNNAQQRAQNFNENHTAYSKNSIDMGLG